MTRISQLLKALLLVGVSAIAIGCASHPVPQSPPAPKPFGSPMGLAWVEAKGDVVITGGAVEHVLLPRPAVTVGAAYSPPHEAGQVAPPRSSATKPVTRKTVRRTLAPTDILDGGAPRREGPRGDVCPLPR